MMLSILTIAGVAFLAFANGANDVSKGVATLAGSGRASYRTAIAWGTLWTFANDGGGMAMAHPMHIHGVRFRILERSGGVPESLREGLVDSGFKDTFLVFPGERVRLAVTPTEPGLFMYQCHNLEHEDDGMMRNCRFGPRARGQG